MSKVVSVRQRHVEKRNGSVVRVVGNTLALCKAMATTKKIEVRIPSARETIPCKTLATARDKAKRASAARYTSASVYVDGSEVAYFDNGAEHSVEDCSEGGW